MTSQVLVSKLFIPRTRASLVHRPRLVDRLDGGLHRKLTLISAPAGFGKTTLVSGWLNNLKRGEVNDRLCKSRIAWLSLDKGENDVVRFLVYVIAALHTVEPELAKGVLSALQSPQPPAIETMLTALINEIAAIPDQIIFVLDDYHLIEAQAVHDAMNFLLENLPLQMHFVIATREDPTLFLSRLRARAQLTELRAADLRFTSAEAAEFLNQTMGLGLAEEDIATLETRTEGWIAGLQLAAISMQGRSDVSNLIQTFAGSHRYVLDYLIEEVLDQQSEDMQIFLLQTAILNRMTGSLCDALTGQENGQETLEQLEHVNLFIIPLDEERRWYRFHRLFADLLLQRLKKTLSGELRVLHQRASVWYEQNDLTDEAIEHALYAEDYERAAHLIEKVTEAVWVRSEDSKYKRWLDVLPVELVCSKPQLCIFHAWHLYLGGQIEEAEHRLDAADLLLANVKFETIETPTNEDNHITLSEARKLQGRAAVVRSVLVSFQGDVEGLIFYAKKALAQLPKDDLAWRSTAIMSLGDAYDFLGEINSAYQSRLEALEVSKATGNIYMILFANLNLVFTLRDMGRLQHVQDICHQQVELANQYGLSKTGVVGWLLASWGEVLAEINELERALQLAVEGVRLVEESKDVLMLNWSYLRLVRVLFSRGEFEDAEEIIQRMQQSLLQHNEYLWASNRMRAWQARIWLAKDQLETANQWISEIEPDIDKELSPLHNFDYYILARFLIVLNRMDDAAMLLQRLFEAAQTGEYTSRMIESLILLALTFQANGDMTQAMDKLEKALTLAEEGGFIRIFIDEGSPMAHMLYEALSRGVVLDYTRQLLLAFPMIEGEQVATPQTQESRFELVEPLSEREIEVLQFISDGLINQQIANRLYISINTVKTHTRNIYGKLGVNNRTQAVARAKIMGILS